MLDENIKIILPSVIPLLKPEDDQDLTSDREEFNIYFKNIIYPYSDDLEIEIECEYGRNMGNCWRINEFKNVPESFELKVIVYAPYGRVLAEKKVEMRVYDKHYNDDFTLLPLGDSMTRSEYYIEQAIKKSRPATTIGSRSIDLCVKHCGMGGWKCKDFFDRYHDDGAGASEFLFPKNVPGNKYWGDKLFNERRSGERRGWYSYRGFCEQELCDGMYFYDDGLKKMENGQAVPVNDGGEFEFSISKYLDKISEKAPDAISILFGSNELQVSKYEDIEADTDELVEYINRVVISAKEADSKIKVIICLPPSGSDQYAWGLVHGCRATAKRYDYAIKIACEKLIKAFDNRIEEGIFICDMSAFCDPDYGIETAVFNANLHSAEKVTKQANWVHPNISGYRQMGDALGAVIAMLRRK